MGVPALLMSLFIVQPLAEYWLHRAAHRMQLAYHVSHHTRNSRGRYWGYKGDAVCRLFVVVLVWYGQYTAALALIKYEITHIMVHRIPSLRYLHRHHFIHHRNPDVNYSFGATWPDRLFGTLEA